MRSVILENNWLYVQDPSVSLGRIQIYNNWSPDMLAHPETDVLLGLEYFCSFEDTMWEKSDADLFELGISDLQRLRILKDKPTDAEYHVERVEKAYPGYYGSYSAMPQIRSYLNHFTNMYCIGRNGQHRYNNMDHSILTATAAVDCILHEGNKEAVWSINSERSYNG